MKRILPLTRALIIPLCFLFLHYGNNASKIALPDILIPVVITILFCCLIFVIFQAITKSTEISIFLSGIFFFLFFNFDNFTSFLMDNPIIFRNDSTSLLLLQKTRVICLILLGIFFAIIAFFLLTTKKDQKTFEKFNIYFSVGMVIVIISSVVLENYIFVTKPLKFLSNSFYPKWKETLTSEADLIHPAAQLPDIYYIILDGYGREDVLMNYYGIDNKPFLDGLAKLGFGISQGALSNYKQTDLSVSSLLNLDYINWVGDQVGKQNSSYFPLYYLIDHNRVFEQLRRVGYRIDSFATGFEATETDTADMVFRPRFYPNNYETLLIKATPLSFFWDSWLYDLHRERIRFGLQNLAKAGNQDGPDFVFLHVFAPHPPFVFGPDGVNINPDHPYSVLDGAEFLRSGTVEEYKTGYTNQIEYLNKEVLSAVRSILHTSSTPPIIIIQGDHGPGSELDHQHLEKSNLAERYPILYAYFIPCGTGNPIPQDITPVNSFRYIFNTCFNADSPYLENRQYFSSSLTPYALVDVTESLKKQLETEK